MFPLYYSLKSKKIKLEDRSNKRGVNESISIIEGSQYRYLKGPVHKVSI